MSKRSAAVVATGTIRAGVVRLDNKDAAAADLKTIRDGGVVLTVEPSTERGLRSVRMMRYYRGVVLPRLAAVTGASPDALHALLTQRLLGRPVELVSPRTGEVFTGTVTVSTADLDADDLWSYIEQVRAWALEAWGVAVPAPDPEWRSYQQGAA
jgi:hypothetical protein